MLYGDGVVHNTLAYSAALATDRLRTVGLWRPEPKHTMLSGGAVTTLAPGTLQDKMHVRYSFGHQCKVVVPTQGSWQNPKELLPANEDIWYTDGF